MPNTKPPLHAVLPALVRERLLAGDDATELGRTLVSVGTAVLAGAHDPSMARLIAMVAASRAAGIASGE